MFWIGFSIPVALVLPYIVGYSRLDFPVITAGIENSKIYLGRYVLFLHGRLNFLIVAVAHSRTCRCCSPSCSSGFHLDSDRDREPSGVGGRPGRVRGNGGVGGREFIAFCLWVCGWRETVSERSLCRRLETVEFWTAAVN